MSKSVEHNVKFPLLFLTSALNEDVEQVVHLLASCRGNLKRQTVSLETFVFLCGGLSSTEL